MVFNILAVWFQSSVMFQTWPDVIWECTLVRVWGGIGVCSWGRCACATVNTGYRRPQYTQRDVHTNFSHAHFYIKRNLLYKIAISQDFKKYSLETIFSINTALSKWDYFYLYPFIIHKKIIFLHSFFHVTLSVCELAR